MRVSVLILAPSGRALGDLAPAFRTETPAEWEVTLVSSREQLLRLVADSSQHHLAVVPDRLDDDTKPALALVRDIREAAADVPIVVAAEKGDVELAAAVIEAGATDLLVCGERLPQRIATLLGKLRKLFDVIDRNRLLDEHNAQLRETIQSRLKIVGNSPQIRDLLDQVRRVAAIPRPVMIVGERGTGKELVARAIHFAGGASTRPIVTVNCAAFGDALLESELFGHEKGAFTGADALRRGKFEQADGGTLFLDEIGSMSLPFQKKTLRVVEYRTYSRVGGTVEQSTSARIIAATNRNLPEMIDRGEFLADLHDRLAFETIRVPPLRERPGDIEVLARYFLDQFARETPSMGGKTLSDEAIDVLRQHHFPGNVRELKNLVERAAYRDTADKITPADLGMLPGDDPAGQGGSFHEKMDATAARLLHGAMAEANGNQAQAARILGLSYHQFRYYHKKYSPGR
ncbi:MAG: sigma-54 dependent transcriptional regulator [Planctomycetia bacterium]|nr:sigma-54 dependent transcriptional regulator [Planctomycetia bacterium]